MNPLSLSEIARLDRYAELRPEYRARVIAHKRHRRIGVGDKVTLVFEDRETLRFQVQEMCWIERIAHPSRVQAELDVYNELMPGPHELSATLFVEITEGGRIREELDRLVGIDEHVFLVLGEGADELRIQARFDPKQMEEERISAVQYIRFVLGEEGARRFRDPAVPARIRIDHPRYRHEAPVRGPVREALCRSLSGPEAGLLPLAEGDAVAEPEDELWFETARVRAWRPARPRGHGHVIVELRDEGASLLDADPDLLVEVFAALRRAAEELVRTHGRCRIQTDVGAEGERGRWHLHAPER